MSLIEISYLLREAYCLVWAYNKADKSITTFTRF